MCQIYRVLMTLLEDRKTRLISFLIMAIMASLGYGFEMPMTSDYTEGSYHCLEKDSGTERWRVDWRIEKFRRMAK